MTILAHIREALAAPLRGGRRRLSGEQGFTLIELLIVLVILAILIAIAVPAYLGFKDRAERGAARSNVRAAVPSLEAWYVDNVGYTGVTPPLLKASYDAGLSDSLQVVYATGGAYCLQDTVGNATAYLQGPGGDVLLGTCPASPPVTP